jgi:3-oxoacyl-[acyl-carrier protein] reductase
MFDLTDRMALVTGATGGIGGAIARALHKQGATVAVSGRQTEKLEKLAAELGGARVHVLPCDLADRAAVAGLVEAATAKLGRVDILVNNAGLTRDNLLMVMKDEQWDDVIAVNLTATFTLMRAAARAMMRAKTGYGRIVNISSVSGILGNPGQGNYAASKAGMIGMSKSLAREVASRGITVNCVAPGFISTAMTDVLNEKQVGAIKEAIPAQKFGTPADIAAACVYLASSEAGYMTGQTLHVNGGLAMI